MARSRLASLTSDAETEAADGTAEESGWMVAPEGVERVCREGVAEVAAAAAAAAAMAAEEEGMGVVLADEAAVLEEEEEGPAAPTW